ncbi:MAG: hypothetical protein U0798_13185 [Gemmataceae bacterium]
MEKFTKPRRDAHEKAMTDVLKQPARPRTRRHLVGVAVVALVVSTNGCKLFDRSRDGGTGNGTDVATRDPLLGGRLIPKQDIPIPGKSDLAESKDPLFRAGQAANNNRREPFQLGPENTSAALAGKPRDDVPNLDDTRNNASRGPVPFKPSGRTDAPLTASIPNLDNQLSDLQRLGAKFNQPTRDQNGEYVFSAEWSASTDGPTRRYNGAGITAGAAVNQVLEQIKADRNGR